MKHSNTSTKAIGLSRDDAIRLIALSALLDQRELELFGSVEQVAVAEKAIREISKTLARQLGSNA